MHRFHKVGTKHKSYIKRLNDKYSNISKFLVERIDKHSINILANDKVIDRFTSMGTLNQFLLTLKSFNMITPKGSQYVINYTKFNLEKMFEAVMEVSSEKSVMIYRDSRKMCMLHSLNMFDEKQIKSNGAHKTKGPLTVKDIKTETSIWEEEMMKNKTMVAKFLKGVEDEYKV